MPALWVVPRYGAQVVGGAERHVRALVSNARPDGWPIALGQGLGAASRALVLDTCSGSAVRERFRAVVERLAA
jgi:hypothetical protein